MYHYSVFGGCLETEIEFPELQPTSRRDPRWTFRLVPELEDRSDLREIGDQHIYGNVHARLFRHQAGHRITVDDTGAFEIDLSGTNIWCCPKPDAWPDFIRAHLLGRVLATALYARGLLPLHGSAVQFRTGVVGFLAPKKFGKSTLALALARAGSRLVTDDTLPIELSDPIRSWPGVHSVRIATDSMHAVGISSADLATREGKGVVTSLPQERLAFSPAPFTAVYLLNPVAPQAGAELQRERLSAAAATVSLVANFKLARMTGAAEMPELLSRAAAIVAHVPVYRLLIPRDFGALPMVTEAIMAWHGESVRSPSFAA